MRINIKYNPLVTVSVLLTGPLVQIHVVHRQGRVPGFCTSISPYPKPDVSMPLDSVHIPLLSTTIVANPIIMNLFPHSYQLNMFN